MNTAEIPERCILTDLDEPNPGVSGDWTKKFRAFRKC